MPTSWKDLLCEPSPAALHELGSAWGWLVNESFTGILFCAIGDAFIEKESGGIWWLNTGTGELTRVADNVPEFECCLSSDAADEWFLPRLVEQLHQAGKVPEQGQCYTFVTPPVFVEGKYEVSNMHAVTAQEHYGLSGKIIREIRDLPDGATVRIKVEK